MPRMTRLLFPFQTSGVKILMAPQWAVSVTESKRMPTSSVKFSLFFFEHEFGKLRVLIATLPTTLLTQPSLYPSRDTHLKRAMACKSEGWQCCQGWLGLGNDGKASSKVVYSTASV